MATYFSARDGWRGTSTTISAPLATINSCSSTRWSLITLTHEFSHIIISAILADLYPDFTDPSEIKSFRALWYNNKPGAHLFEEIQRIILFSILEMNEAGHGITSAENYNHYLQHEELKILLRRWQPYIEETMVHVFDFLYFYGRDVERYIRGIWASWGTIPNVSSRIEDYVVRSISAVLSHHWRRADDAEDLAKQEVTSALQKLQESKLGGRYVEEALQLLDKKWDSHIKRQVRARRQLVKIVSTYLFSEEIASNIRGESEISGGTKDTEGYPLHPGHIDERSIRNPLRFIEIYTKLAEPSIAHSVWMLYTLAFCVQSND